MNTIKNNILDDVFEHLRKQPPIMADDYPNLIYDMAILSLGAPSPELSPLLEGEIQRLIMLHLDALEAKQWTALLYSCWDDLELDEYDKENISRGELAERWVPELFSRAEDEVDIDDL